MSAPPADRRRLARRLDGVASSPVRDLLALTARPEVISFAGGLPAPELFDVDGIRAAYERALAGSAARLRLQYAASEGDARLRGLIAARLTGRGLPTGADDLVVTTGSQQALSLVATALLDPGAVVAVEDPTYLAALQAFGLAGARLVPVRSDADGIDPDDLAAVCARERPTLLYLVPTFANPTGRTLPADRRAVVAAVARQHGLWVIEDDPYGELRYRGAPVAPLAAGDADDRVLYLGSFSKIGAPGMRLGWLRASGALRRALVVAKQAADLHSSAVDQAAAAEYLAHADLDAHVRTLCAEYDVRRGVLRERLLEALPPGTTCTDPDGGMFLWARLPEGHDATALLTAALRQDVAFVPGATFHVGTPDPRTLRLSFTTNPVERIGEGVARLGRAVARV